MLSYMTCFYILLALLVSVIICLYLADKRLERMENKIDGLIHSFDELKENSEKEG